MEQESIGDEFECALDGEDSSEEVVKVTEGDVDVRLGLEGVLTGEEGRGHEDADKDKVRHDGVPLKPVTEIYGVHCLEGK